MLDGRLTFAAVVIGVALLFPLDASGQKRKKKKASKERTWPLLVRKGVYDELPSVLVRETPFEVESFYAIPPSKNREQLYNRTWFVMESGSQQNWIVDPRAMAILSQDRELLKRTRKTSKALIDLQEFMRSTKAFSRRGGLGKLQGRELKNGKRIMKDLQWVLDDVIEATGQREACFLRAQNQKRHFHTDSFQEQVSPIAQLWYLTHPDEMDLELMRALLQLHRDSLPLGKRSYSASLENLVLDPFVERYLNDCQTEQEIDDLIEVVNEHREKRKGINAALELQKAVFLDRCMGLLLCRDKVYLNDVGPRGQSTPQLAAVQYFPLSGFRHHGVGQNKWITRHFKELRELELVKWVDFEKEILDELEKKAMQGQIDIGSMVLEMKEADFAREIEIEKQRYGEISAAFELPDKQRDEQLEKLSKVWTLDGSWKKSVLRLLEFRPPHIYADKQGECEADMALALAALVKFRMAHNNKAPKDLKQAFAFARCGPVPVDPFSGKPLQMRIVGRKFGVVSVGPDGIGDEVVGDDGKARKQKRQDDIFVWVEVDK